MKIYAVSLTIYVEANSEEEAKDMFEDLVDHHDWYSNQIDVEEEPEDL